MIDDILDSIDKRTMVIIILVLTTIIIFDEITYNMWKFLNPMAKFSAHLGRQPGPPPISNLSATSQFELDTHSRPAQYYVRQYSRY